MSRDGLGLLVLAAVLVALVSTPVSAETDVYASGVMRGKYLYNMDDEIESSAADTRVELDIGIGAVTLGAVYRAYQLSDPAYNPAGVDIPEAEIKHRYVNFDHEDFYAAAGHFPVTFGRGLTLRSYEDADLEHDALLDGFLAEYDAGLIGVTALTGVAREDDSASRFYSHVVRGARASMPVGEWIEIGGSVVERSRTWEDDLGTVAGDFSRFEDGVTGGEFSLWSGPVTIAAEYVDRTGDYPDAAKRVDPSSGEFVYSRDQVEKRGHATYAAATLDLGWATLFGEVKDYDDIDHRMINPPTCVRDHLYTLMNRATYQPDLNDEKGFLVEGSAPIGDELYVTGGASEARNHDSDLRHWEMFGQATYTMSEGSVAAAGSMSREYLFGAGGATGKFTEHLIGAIDASYTISSEHAVEATIEAQIVEEPSGLSSEDFLFAAGWYAGLDLIVTASFEATTSESEDRSRWTMVSVKRAFPGDLEVELGAGTERGGKKCVGGTCFFEPEFEGVRLRFTKFF